MKFQGKKTKFESEDEEEGEDESATGECFPLLEQDSECMHWV